MEFHTLNHSVYGILHTNHTGVAVHEWESYTDVKAEEIEEADITQVLTVIFIYFGSIWSPQTEYKTKILPLKANPLAEMQQSIHLMGNEDQKYWFTIIKLNMKVKIYIRYLPFFYLTYWFFKTLLHKQDVDYIVFLFILLFIYTIHLLLYTLYYSFIIYFILLLLNVAYIK